MGAISYPEFISRYVNTRNPSTGMYYTLDEISALSGTDLATLEGYLNVAQIANLASVQTGGDPLTQAQLIAAEPIPPGPATVVPKVTPDQPAPAGDSVIYYNSEGEPYTDEFQAFWKTPGGDWYVGDKTGAIAAIDYPPWLPPVTSPVTSPGPEPGVLSGLPGGIVPLLGAGVGYAFGGLLGAVIGFGAVTWLGLNKSFGPG